METSSNPQDQPTLNLDAAKRLRSFFDHSRLHILDAQTEFISKPIDVLEDWLAPGDGSGGGHKSPSVVAADVIAQTVRFSRLSASPC